MITLDLQDPEEVVMVIVTVEEEEEEEVIITGKVCVQLVYYRCLL